MKLNISLITILIVSGITTAFSSSEYRLVSGDRGVILSVGNVSAEPEIEVELVDDNLAVSIKEVDSRENEFSETIQLAEGMWADSIVAVYGINQLDMVFHNFRLPIEDMQKKFNNNRFMLLLSQTASPAFDCLLPCELNNTMTSISEISISSRDGLEFLEIAGTKLSSVEISSNDDGILLQFANEIGEFCGLDNISEELLTDSVNYSLSGSGIPTVQLHFDTDNSLVKLINSRDDSFTLILSDLREKEIPSQVYVDNNASYSFELNDQIGTTVTENASTSVSEIESSNSSSETIEDLPELIDDSRQVMYLIRENVNIRSTPSASSNENVIGQFSFGTRMVSLEKQNSWFHVIIADTINGWVYHSLVEDSSDITPSQWDRINNSVVTMELESESVLDEFNSPGEDPLLSDNRDNVFDVDSTSIGDENTVASTGAVIDDEPVIEEVVIESYTKFGRDPFLPLTSSDFLKPDLPQLDAMTLVGIIYDPQDGIALFEELVDGDAVSFSMRAGERVENGKVLRIYESKVVFLMWESDISYTVEKELIVEKE